MNKLQIATLSTELLQSEVREEWLWDELCADFIFEKKKSESYFSGDPERSDEDKKEAVRDCLLVFCEIYIAPEFNIPVPRRNITTDRNGAMILDIGMMFRDNSGTVTLRPNRSQCGHNFRDCSFGEYQGYEKCIHCNVKREK